MSHPLFNANGNWIGAPLDFMRTKSLGQSQQKEQCPGCGQELDEEGICPCEKNKDMSAMDATRGGALVAPPAMGRKRRGRNMQQFESRLAAQRKSLVVARMKSGFTGSYIDEIGRQVCFRDGRRVACESGNFEVTDRPGDAGAGGGGRGSRVGSAMRRIYQARRSVVAAVGIMTALVTGIVKSKTIAKELAAAVEAYKNYKARANPDADQLRKMRAAVTELRQEKEAELHSQRELANALVGAKDEHRAEVLENLSKIPEAEIPYVWQVMKNSNVPQENYPPRTHGELTEGLKMLWRHKDWMSATPERGENERAFTVRLLPSLKNLETLDVKDISDPQVRQHLYELSLLPEESLTRLSKQDIKVFVGKGSVVDLDDNGYLKGQPAAAQWPGADSFDNLAGYYNAVNKQVNIGTTGVVGTASLSLHVAGHAVWNATEGGSRTPEQRRDFINAMRRAHYRLDKAGKLTPYEKASSRDLFAESIAVLIMKGQAEATKRYDEDYVNWLTNVLQWR